MGKTTLYHPVSLQTIRGAANAGGFKLGRITQDWSDQSLGCATYTAEVTGWPNDLDPFRVSLASLIGALDGCFAVDVECILLYPRTYSKWIARFSVDLHRAPSKTEPLFPALVQE